MKDKKKEILFNQLIQALEEQDAEKALSLAKSLEDRHDSMYIESLALRSAAFKLSGNYGNALKLLTQALNQKPDNPSLKNNKATLYEAMGKTKEAAILLEEIISKHPNFQDAKNNLIMLRKKLESRRLPSSEMREEAMARVSNPLLAAFASNEVEQNRKSRSEAQKKRRSK